MGALSSDQDLPAPVQDIDGAAHAPAQGVEQPAQIDTPEMGTTGTSAGPPPTVLTAAPTDVAAGPPTPARPRLSVSAAARACGVSRRTIHRRLAEQAFPEAVQAEDGTWSIPVEDLLAAGLRLHAPATGVPIHAQGADGAAHAPAQGEEQGAHRPGQEVGALRAALDAAERRAVEAERRVEVLEAVASERGRALATLELALRALQPGPSSPAPQGTGDSPASPRSRWWRRQREAAGGPTTQARRLVTGGSQCDRDHPPRASTAPTSGPEGR
jgi:hypothetical protein